MCDAEVDVAVVGAGPAGAATARRLALRGLRVVLFERSIMQATRIGESLAPSVQAALQELGVWDQFVALAPLPSFGTRSVWGRAEPEAHSHLMSPWGCGWHVDRAAFDRMLAEAAADAGAALHLGTTVRYIQRSDRRWELRVEQADGPPTSVRASVLVDATGRSASVARQLSARVLRFDALVGVSCLGPALAPDERAHLLVEASPDGWWYAAPVPRGDSIIMLMTDADLCSRGGLHRADRLSAAVDRAPALRARVGPSWAPRNPRVHRAHAQRLLRAERGGPPWLAVGDAALAVDPLSGSGVVRALTMARRAAECVMTVVACSGSDARHASAALAAYEEHCDEACTVHLVERAEHYAQEQRFKEAFWARRHTTARALQEQDGALP